jgi:4'-phosphopantetheinyl transferase
MSVDEFANAGNSNGNDMTVGARAWPSPLPGIDVWSVALTQPVIAVEALYRHLSAAEHARAARFGMPELRSRYIVGRATLRQLLGARLGCEPAHVDIRRERRGRPFAHDANGLDFNVSHTGNVGVFAFGTGVRIGIDVEHQARTLNLAGVARKFMSRSERDVLAQLDEDARRLALLRLWTCKEAMSKATGDALSAPFREINVIREGHLHLGGGPPPYTPADWQLAAVDGPADHLITVAQWTGR